MSENNDIDAFDESIELPIDGILDLHTFHPSDAKTLLPDYLELCREKDIYRVRIIHGKGTGAMRRTVHALLDRSEIVESYRLAEDQSHWGATLVFLRRQ